MSLVLGGVLRPRRRGHQQANPWTQELTDQEIIFFPVSPMTKSGATAIEYGLDRRPSSPW